MKTRTAFLEVAVFLAAAAIGCGNTGGQTDTTGGGGGSGGDGGGAGGDGGGGDGGGGGGGGGGTSSGIVDPPGPPLPAIGHQIDRVGRDGVNMAVTDPWGLMEVFSFQDRDIYNRASDRAQWPALFSSRIEFSLGIWDGVDGMCGNQLDAGAMAVGGRYHELTKLLVDDVLLVDTSQAKCDTYLAVELSGLGMPVADCGGRTPAMDTADITMTLVAAGMSGHAADGSWLFTDGISSDKDGAASMSEFPFLLASGIGTPGSSMPGAIDPAAALLVCAGLGEARCNQVYKCWGRDNIPADQRAAYGYEVDKCVRQMDADCRGLSKTGYMPSCTVYDPQKLRDCERKYSLATCAEVQAAGAGLLDCGDLCAVP